MKAPAQLQCCEFKGRQKVEGVSWAAIQWGPHSLHPQHLQHCTADGLWISISCPVGQISDDICWLEPILPGPPLGKFLIQSLGQEQLIVP